MNELPDEFVGEDTAAQLAAVETECIYRTREELEGGGMAMHNCTATATVQARFAHLPVLVFCPAHVTMAYDSLSDKGWAFTSL